MGSMRDRLIAEIEEWLWGEQAPPAPEPTSEHTIEHDTFDEMTWEFLKGSSKMIAKENADFEQFFDTGGQAFQDLFHLLYLSDPRMKSLAEMLPEFHGNHHVIEAFSESEEVEALRRLTFLDDYQSGFALLSMSRALYDALSRLEEARQAQQDAENAAAEAAQGLADAVQAGAGDQELQQALEDAQGAKAAAQAAQEATEKVQEQVAVDVGLAAQEAADDIKESTQVLQTYGFGPEKLQRMDFDRRRHLSERLRKGRMQKLAAMIGAWKPVARAERRKRVKHEPGEVYDYTMGNDLDKVVPDEFNRFAMPETEDLFLLRYAQQALLSKKERGPAKAGRGPIILCCDESQSMEGKLDAAGNTKEMWSKALAISMADQARKEKRDFTYVGFCTTVVYERTFKGGDIPLDGMIDFVEHFGNGGTSFLPPLQRALSMIQECDKRGETRPDILFVTDGQGHVADSFLEKWHPAMEKVEAKCYAVQVGDTKIAAALSQITDKVLHINQLNANPEGVAELFRNI